MTIFFDYADKTFIFRKAVPVTRARSHAAAKLFIMGIIDCFAAKCAEIPVFGFYAGNTFLKHSAPPVSF